MQRFEGSTSIPQVGGSLRMADRLEKMDRRLGACPSDPHGSDWLIDAAIENKKIMDEVMCLIESFKLSCRVFYAGGNRLPVPSPKIYDRRFAAALRLLTTVFGCYSSHTRISFDTRCQLLYCIGEFFYLPDVWEIIRGRLEHLQQSTVSFGTDQEHFAIPDPSLLRTLKKIQDNISDGAAGAVDWRTLYAHFCTVKWEPSEEYYPSISECLSLLRWLEYRMPWPECGDLLPRPVLGDLVLLSDEMGYEDLEKLVEGGEAAERMIKEGKAVHFSDLDFAGRIRYGLHAVRLP